VEFGIHVKNQAQAKTCVAALEEHMAIGIKFQMQINPEIIIHRRRRTRKQSPANPDDAVEPLDDADMAVQSSSKSRLTPMATEPVKAPASLEQFVELSPHPIDWTETQLRILHASNLRLLCQKYGISLPSTSAHQATCVQRLLGWRCSAEGLRHVPVNRLRTLCNAYGFPVAPTAQVKTCIRFLVQKLRPELEAGELLPGKAIITPRKGLQETAAELLQRERDLATIVFDQRVSRLPPHIALWQHSHLRLLDISVLRRIVTGEEDVTLSSGSKHNPRSGIHTKTAISAILNWQVATTSFEHVQNSS
jgi:hypothetical protein